MKYKKAHKRFGSDFPLFLTIMLIIAVISESIMYVNERGNYTDRVYQTSLLSTHRIASISDALLKEAEMTISNAGADLKIQTYMYSKISTEIFSSLPEYVTERLKSYIGVNRYINGMGIYSGTSGRMCTTDGETVPDEYFKNSVIKTDKTVLFNEDGNIMLLKRFGTEKSFGIIYMTIKASRFISSLKEMTGENFILNFFDSNNELEYKDRYEETLQPDFSKKESDIEKINGEYYGISSVKSRFYDFKYVSAIKIPEYRSEVRGIIFRNALMAALMLFAALALSMFFAWYTFEPIKNILEIIEKPEFMMTGKKRKIRDGDMERIINKITLLLNSENDLKNQLSQRLELLKEANMNVMRSQLNPHFIFNTLNIISWTVIEETGDDSKSLVMINELSQFLRYCMDSQASLVRLGEELEFTMKYMSLLKHRYGKQLEFNIDIDDTLYKYNVPKLCMQPLIENCVTHGMNGTDKIIVTIGAREKDGNLYITVKDNGKGIEEERLKQITNLLKSDRMYDMSHIGVKNVKYRLDILFGADGDLKIESVYGKGTNIIIKIPMQNKEQD